LATLANTTIPDAGTLGSVSDTDAISISSTGVVAISATLDVSSATLTTSTAQKEAVVQAGPGSGTLDVSSGTLTTSTAQKQAISYTAFASGTAMIFKQNSAPTGWTKVASNDNSALRVVTGDAGTGGSVAFTTAFQSHTPSQSGSASVSSHVLAENEMPSHQHGISIGDSLPGHTGGHIVGGPGGAVNSKVTGAKGGAGSHTHSMGQASYSAINLAVNYVDVIVATKD